MAKKSEIERQLDDLDDLHAKGRITDQEYGIRRSAIMASSPSVASGNSRRGGIFKWGLFGCLGILAVIGVVFIALIAILGAALESADDDAPDSGGDVRVALKVGAVGVIAPEGNGSKQSRVQILQIVDGVPSENQFIQPGPGRKWIGFEVVIENVGTKQVTSLDWTLRDSANLEHRREPWTGASDSALDLAYVDLSPGGRKQGWIYFEVDQAASVQWLRADPNWLLADDLYFDAQ